MRTSVPRPGTAALVLVAILSIAGSAALDAVLAADPSATVEVSVNSSGATTRMVLTHSRRLVYAVTTFDGRIEVVYADPVEFRPEAGNPGDGLLDRFEVRGDRTLVVWTGPGYEGYDDFELRNPFRLVVDLRGDRTVKPVDRGPDGTRVPAAAPERRTRRVVVLDPGHGGIETGAVGPRGLAEKDVALDIARRLRTALADDDVTVVLTRDGDRHVELDERTAIANHNRSDLFVSIHLNASRRVAAQGAETYYLSTDASDDEARTLAGLENAAGADPANARAVPEMHDRGLDMVLWDLAQNQYLAESAALAESIQGELNHLAGTRDRGVRQAPFRVLVGATMPAILVEVGFITSPDEAVLFGQPAYRDRVAEALARAIRAYLGTLASLNAPGSSVGAIVPEDGGDAGASRRP